MNSPAKGPLDGLTLLDLSRDLAGPFGTVILADLGARVIKVEAPGQHSDHDGHAAKDDVSGEDARYFGLARNKERVVLNLASARGREVFLAMVSHADVVFTDYPREVMAALGLDDATLSAANPSVLSVSLSPFGAYGPYRDRPGSELVVQALAGGMSMTGEPGRAPVQAGNPIAGLSGGMWAAIAILAAIRGRDEQLAGGGAIDIALFDGQLAMVPYFAAYYFLDGSVPGPQGSGGHSPTYGAFRCSDDRYVIIAAIDQVPWSKLCDALRRPDLFDDERFATSHLRASNGDVLTDVLQSEFSKLPAAEWDERLYAADLAYARVNRLDEALTDPQVIHRGMIAEVLGQQGDNVRVVGNPVKYSAFPPRMQAPAARGEHTDAVLAELGFGLAEIGELRSNGVI
jgi:crotonobetainyl-CoA:carnitine CoA-transferase CaiB-like acyl-CoA transferase